MGLTASSPAPEVAPPSPASVTSESSGTAISPLFNKLPLEIHQQVYRHVFAGSVMLGSSHADGKECEFCSHISPSALNPSPGSTCSQASLCFQGPANYRVLLTCQAIYLEARPILASSLTIYMSCSGHTAAKQIIRVLNHDTFLRYAIPHIQCLNVQLRFGALVPILQHLSSLQNLTVKVWEVFSQQLEMSDEEYMSPRSDQKLIQLVKRRISQGYSMMKSFDCLDRRFKVKLRWSVFSFDCWDFKYVFEYDVDSDIIFSKHFYQFDYVQRNYVDRISGNRSVAVSNSWSSIKEATRANWDENYAVHRLEVREEEQRTEAARQSTADKTESTHEEDGKPWCK